MVYLTPSSRFVLERLFAQFSDYRYNHLAHQLGMSPREWLNAVQTLVKWHCAEARNVSREVVAVRHTLGDYPILYAGQEQRVYFRQVIPGEPRPLWIKEVYGQVIPNPVSIIDPQTLQQQELVMAVAYMRYEDQWIIEVIPAA